MKKSDLFLFIFFDPSNGALVMLIKHAEGFYHLEENTHKNLIRKDEQLFFPAYFHPNYLVFTQKRPVEWAAIKRNPKKVISVINENRVYDGR